MTYEKADYEKAAKNLGDRLKALAASLPGLSGPPAVRARKVVDELSDIFAGVADDLTQRSPTPPATHEHDWRVLNANEVVCVAPGHEGERVRRKPIPDTFHDLPKYDGVVPDE